MRLLRTRDLVLATLTSMVAMGGGPSGADEELSKGARQILKKYCFSCHGPDSDSPKAGLRVDSTASLKKGGKSKKSLIAGGKIDESLLWQRVGIKRNMPPKGKSAPSSLERYVLRKWIAAGGVLPATTPPKPKPKPKPTPKPKPVDTSQSKLSDAEAVKLAQRGYGILKKYCHRCHGADYKTPRLDVLAHERLIEKPKSEDPFVIPGKPEDSLLWTSIEDEAMPPDTADQPTAAEKEAIRLWIAAGFPKHVGPIARENVSEVEILDAIQADLRKASRRDRKFYRYFSLANLHNNKTVAAEELRLYRAALSKVCNSLSKVPDIAVPKAVDDEQVVYRIDLRDYGWEDIELWKKVLEQYPYGMVPDDLQAFERFEEVKELMGGLIDFDGVPYLRADWFVVNASRPPLYYDLLKLPETVEELEKDLGVDPERDFLNDRVARAAFFESGVSDQNRVVDRHQAAFGFYWKSYDFLTNTGKGNVASRPLGPKFDDNPFNDLAFEHAGGELIFSLPNGLNGYFLALEDGKRIAEGPRDVVRDLKQISGSDKIVNGVSCMGCHRHGLIKFEDSVGPGFRGEAKARQKVQALYRSKEEMDKLVERDRRRFLRALEEATGEFLLVAEDAGKDIKDLPEPIAAAVAKYNRDMSLEEIARELDEKPAAVKAQLQGNQDLINRFGLGPLLSGRKIKRSVWHSLREGSSPFQELARKFGKGTPVRPG